MKPFSWDKQLGLASPLKCAAIQSGQTKNPSKNEVGLDVSHQTRTSPEGRGKYFFLDILSHRMSAITKFRQLCSATTRKGSKRLLRRTVPQICRPSTVRMKWQSSCTLLAWVRYGDCFCWGSIMRNKLLAVQSILEMAENWAKVCLVPGHSPLVAAQYSDRSGLLTER